MKKYILFFLVCLVASVSQAQILQGDTCLKIDRYLSNLEKEKGFSGGLLIIKDGKKIFSQGYGWADKEQKTPFTATTLASIGSITKAFTATAIMKLQEQGKLSVNDKLGKYLPGIPIDKASITIHQLLTHSSGFHEFENDGGDYETIKTDAFLKRVWEAPLAFQPGEKAVYSNVNFSLLAILVEKISGLDYEAFLKRELFIPIGIKHMGYQYPTEKEVQIAHGYQNGNDWGTHQSHFEKAGGGPYWNLKGNGGLEASLDEMFLWANAFTNKNILQESSIKQLFTKQIVEYDTDNQYYFGYGCNVSSNQYHAVEIDNGGSNGIYYARLVRFPEEGLVFYMVSNESTVGTDKVLPNVRQLYFKGSIEQDFLTAKFQHPEAQIIYDLLVDKKGADLETELKKSKTGVTDDMVLLEVGRKLTEEKKTDEALALYIYYTRQFPSIIVAWNDLGDLYLSRNKKEEAKNCYTQALKLKPDNPRAREALTRIGE